jgi:arginyl-tRNA synthetase
MSSNGEACEYLKKAVLQAIESKFPAAGDLQYEVIIEKPKQKSFGDLSTPVAMSIAKKMHANPANVAREIMSVFVWDDNFVEPDEKLDSTITGGFINFKLSRSYLNGMLRLVNDDPQNFGKVKSDHPKKILFEFVSANPTGPMVVVNGRAAAIGDVMARVNEWLGNDVKREFYVNDYGHQVELLGKSIACRYFEEKGEVRPIPEGGYEGEYIKDLARDISAAHPAIETMSEDDIEKLFQAEALESIISQQRSILENYGVKYDNWFRESQLHKSNAPGRVLDKLHEMGLTYKQDGAVWFMSSKYGDEKDRVLVRQDNTPTYFLSDLAYHVHKASRGFDDSYTFWGPDHHGYLPRLENAVKALSLDNTKFHNFIIQQVNLIRDGKPFRMSKRKGDFITISELLSDVSVDAARYFFLMRRLSTHFDFDMSLAVKKSDDNPVFYVQYAHARTCSLVKHALDRGFTQSEMSAASPERLVEEEELDIMKTIAEFPAMLRSTAQYVEPHRITGYLEGLAASFHRFYQKHRIVTDDRELSLSRLLLTAGASNTIRQGLGLLGVSSPERM